MKSLIGMTLIALTLTATANAQTATPCRWEHSYCHDNFEKSDALEALNKIEGNIDEANSDLRVIEEAVLKNSLNFEPAVGNFVYLLRKVGGAKYTTDIQQTFTQLSQYPHGQMQLAEITEAFSKIYDIELHINDARVGMEKIMELKNQSHVRFHHSVKLYLKLLRLLGGNTATNEVVTAFSAISTYANQFQIDYLYQTFEESFRSDSNFKAALAIFHLEIDGAKSSNMEATKKNYAKIIELLDDGTDEQE
ncbi:hypothetical protein D3C87_1082740 [compost metagenome]